MRDWQDYRERFLRDPQPIRLGGISANLARINSFADRDAHRETVRNVIEDSEYLIEWAGPDLELEVQVELVELQLQLARWYLGWSAIWVDPVQRNHMREYAQKWSDRLLDLSGLLNDETYDKYNIPRR